MAACCPRRRPIVFFLHHHGVVLVARDPFPSESSPLCNYNVAVVVLLLGLLCQGLGESQPSIKSPSAEGIGMNNILGNILCALWWWWVASNANRPYYCSRPLWAIYSCRAKENSQ